MLTQDTSSVKQQNNWQIVVKLQIEKETQKTKGIKQKKKRAGKNKHKTIFGSYHNCSVEKMTQAHALLVLTTLLLQTKLTWSQPADLGAFGTQNDVQPGVIYSFPSEVGRSHSSMDFFALAFINYTYTRQDGHHVVYAQENAKYGEGQIAAVSGQLVHVVNLNDKTDHTACECDLLGTNGQPLPIGKGWIALIKRGDCKFDEKVACVHRNGAIGAIVYDFKDVKVLDKMKIDDKTRKLQICISIFFFFLARRNLDEMA